MEIKKIENCNYVMFPRLRDCGLKPEHVEREAFKAELKHVEGRGDYWLLHQQAKPHVVVHVQLPRTEAEFDNILGFCLGENHWCDYIDGDFAFICVIAGFKPQSSPPSTLILSARGFMPSMLPPDGGMSTVKRCFY